MNKKPEEITIQEEARRIPRYILSALRCPSCKQRLTPEDLAGCDVNRIVFERLTPPLCQVCSDDPEFKRLTELQQVYVLAWVLVETVGNSPSSSVVKLATSLLFAEWTAQAASVDEKANVEARTLLAQALQAQPALNDDPNNLEDEPEPAPETLKG